MKRLTELRALLICLDLWKWLAETGSRHKEDWPGWVEVWAQYGGGAEGDCFRYDCPCCEYVMREENLEGMDAGDPECSTTCPMRDWFNGRCTSETQVFVQWFNEESTLRRSELAREMVKMIERAITKFRAKRKTK